MANNSLAWTPTPTCCVCCLGWSFAEKFLNVDILSWYSLPQLNNYQVFGTFKKNRIQLVGEIVPSKLTALTFMTCSELSSGDRHLISFAQISEWIFKSDLPSATLHCIDVTIIIIICFTLMWSPSSPPSSSGLPWCDLCRSSASLPPTTSCTTSFHSHRPEGCLKTLDFDFVHVFLLIASSCICLYFLQTSRKLDIQSFSSDSWVFFIHQVKK